MITLKIQIQSIIRKYSGAYISGGKRTIDKQIKFVKNRPSQYSKTLKKVFEYFKLDKSKINDKEYLKTVYDGKEKWLKKTILDFARRNQGFQHLSGNAIDVSVKDLKLTSKQNLKKDIEKKGYRIIMEHIAGSNSTYYVRIQEANVFHIDLLNSHITKKHSLNTHRCVNFGHDAY